MAIPKVGLQEAQIDIVGSNKFGRYPKINDSETVNMIISDGWNVPYAGYKKIEAGITGDTAGRGIYASFRYDHMIFVVGDIVYSIDNNLTAHKVGQIDSDVGDVFIAEIAGSDKPTTNPSATQIGICDKKDLYIFDWSANTFGRVDIDFVPSYLSSHGGRFLAAVENQPYWRFSDIGNGKNASNWNPVNTGALQSKPDDVVAIFPFPSKENVIVVMGETVAEIWTNTGAALFPYQRNSYNNFDYGCINPSTIAFSDKFVVWLGSNERSGISLLVSDGAAVTQISTDGINYVLANLTNPTNCNGFLFRQDGHLIYQFTFPDDNISYIYDFNTKSFFTVTDEKLNYHIAKEMVFYDNKYYFNSLNDAFLYQSSSEFNVLNGFHMPKIRRTMTIRDGTGEPFIGQNLSFTLDTGESTGPSYIDLSLSKDGGVTYGNKVRSQLPLIGQRQNKVDFWNLGRANEMTFQLEFWGTTRGITGAGRLLYYI